MAFKVFRIELDHLLISGGGACHGHFGRTPDEGGDGTFSWERTDKAEVLRAAAEQCAGATA